MHAFAHIIAEMKHNEWHAWFRHKPLNICQGEELAYAIATLIDKHGSIRMKWRQITAIEDATQFGYAEFLIPFSSADRPISTSVN